MRPPGLSRSGLAWRITPARRPRAAPRTSPTAAPEHGVRRDRRLIDWLVRSRQTCSSLATFGGHGRRRVVVHRDAAPLGVRHRRLDQAGDPRRHQRHSAPQTADQGLAALRDAAAAHLSPAGQLQVAVALDIIAALEARLQPLRRQLTDAARHLAGAKILAERLYGAGPVTALAMTCWLAGRGPVLRLPQGFAGLDITARSSDGKTHVRAAPPTTTTTPPSRTARTASAPPCPRPARSSARPATSWPSSATTRSPPPDRYPASVMVTKARIAPSPGTSRPQPHSPDGETTAAGSRKPPVSRCRPGHAGPRGRPD